MSFVFSFHNCPITLSHHTYKMTRISFCLFFSIHLSIFIHSFPFSPNVSSPPPRKSFSLSSQAIRFLSPLAHSFYSHLSNIPFLISPPLFSFFSFPFFSFFFFFFFFFFHIGAFLFAHHQKTHQKTYHSLPKHLNKQPSHLSLDGPGA